VGIVGRNGAGKTTLFRLIRGELTLDGGAISLPERARIGGVAQEAPGTEVSLLDTVLAADEERAALLADASEDPHASRRCRRGLPISTPGRGRRGPRPSSRGWASPEEQAMPCSAFSGGWRMRVALAGVLFAQPDLLLLDEPTNYLDLEGALWLESYLARYPHTVLIISHDRGASEPGGGSHPASRGAQADALFRAATTPLPAHAPRPAPCRRPRRRSRRRSARICRPSSTGSRPRRPRRNRRSPAQDAGADDADPHAGGRRADGVLLPRARGAVAAHREPRHGRGGLWRAAGAVAPVAADRPG
jgi:hypothetical protein